ncbi:asparagine synthase (glutamine-hydrolyzing) [candidate division KSB1 bacterium]|nr:asparagine synthase (glutamine-hydrolyzing) [candidate division KSB1 bacterium]
MCGIFGIYFSDHSKPVDREMVIAATNTMTHRGPDNSGFYINKNIGFGHRRLSIIDLSAGHQPMFNEDGKIAITYNGEIYNYRKIRDLLIRKGHIFKTNCDTEVIIHAYEEWSFECLQQFNGMFAFALWDRNKESLWVVRDRLGIKPLYYFWDGKTCIVSSEIKPILKTGFIKPEVNYNVLDTYFSVGYVPGPETMFKNIYKLLPGHYLQLIKNIFQTKEYWDFADVSQTNMPIDEAKQHLESLLVDSVRKRLMSDVSSGAFLSGGLDSSTIVSLMKQIGEQEIKTFTVGYPERSDSTDKQYAQIIANKFNTQHHIFHLEPDDFFSSIKTLVQYSEEPVVEPAAIALYHISKLARKNAIVLLSGEGSDEVFAGYFLYQLMNRINNVQKIIPANLWKMFSPAKVFSPKMKYNKYLDWLQSPLETRYQGTSSYLTDSLKKQIYSEDFYHSHDDYLHRTFSHYFNRVEHKTDTINKMLYVDTKTWLVDDLLLKADKMTMATSIELRVPFLDHRIIEFVSSLPSSLKVRNGSGKHILKMLMKQRLPQQVIEREKMGFPIPVKKWISQEFAESVQTILSENSFDFINKSYANETLSKLKKGQEDNAHFLMSIIVLDFWAKHFGVW